MGRILFNVGENYCDECSLALRRFIGHIEGVESIDIESGHVLVKYDDSKITEEDIHRITKDSIEKLGYKLIEQNRLLKSTLNGGETL